MKYQLDKIIHFFAGGLVVVILSQYFQGSTVKMILLTLLVGSFWELLEYYETLHLSWPFADLSQKNYALDTSLDQVAVGLGAWFFTNIFKK